MTATRAKPVMRMRPLAAACRYLYGRTVPRLICPWYLVLRAWRAAGCALPTHYLGRGQR